MTTAGAAGGGLLMQLAYCVHGAFAAVSPVEIPRKYKLRIRAAIEDLESAFSSSGAAADNKQE